MTNLLIISLCTLILHFIGAPVGKLFSRLLLTLTAIFTLCYLLAYFNSPPQYTTLQF